MQAMLNKAGGAFVCGGDCKFKMAIKKLIKSANYILSHK